MYKTRSRNLQRWSLIETPEKDYLLEERTEKFNNFQKIKDTSAHIRVGDIVQCRVLSIRDSGVIVTVEGVRGFIHISELKNIWVRHPSEIVEDKQYLNAKVISKELKPNGIYNLHLTIKNISKKIPNNNSKNAPKKANAYRWELEEALRDMKISFSRNCSYEKLKKLYERELKRRIGKI